MDRGCEVPLIPHLGQVPEKEPWSLSKQKEMEGCRGVGDGRLMYYQTRNVPYLLLTKTKQRNPFLTPNQALVTFECPYSR